MLEIERKWVLKNKENLSKLMEILNTYECSLNAIVEQSYLHSDVPEVRLRHRHDLDKNIDIFYLDGKSDGTIIREEVTTKLTEEKYHEFKKLLKYNTINKQYKNYIINNKILEFSIVDSGILIYMEIEFESLDEFHNFKLPEKLNELVLEVTDDDSFKMCNYWKITREEGKEWRI